MSSIAVSPLFSSLHDEEKEYINRSIEFLYYHHHEDTLNDDETQRILDDTLAGKDVYGPFHTIEELKESLNA